MARLGRNIHHTSNRKVWEYVNQFAEFNHYINSPRSAEIAAAQGARVIPEPVPGYGSALRAGLARSRGDVIIFGDSDSTYDFYHLDPMYQPLAAGAVDFMIGDRFADQMESGAMSRLHRLGSRFCPFAAG